MIIRAVASSLPNDIYHSSVVAQWCGSDEVFLCEKVGIKNRHFLKEYEDEIDLAALACENLFIKAPNLSKDSIGLCIYVGQVHTLPIPHSSAILQHKLKIPNNCVCFDVGLACSGYIYALSIARGLMESMKIENALLITCDPYSKILNKNDRNTIPLFGDAATATLLCLHGIGLEIGKFDLGTDGSRYTYLTMHKNNGYYSLYMDGKGIFNFAMNKVPKSVAKCLTINNKKKSDIDYFLFHQANLFMIRSLCTAMDIDEKNCPIYIDNVGNTVSSSLPLLLESIFEKLVVGDNIIMSGFGGGLSWGTIYAKFLGVSND